MGTLDVMAAIQAVNAGIPLIASAPLYAPLTLDGTTLPVALVKPGSARWWGGGGLRSKVRAKRTYTVLYFLAATSSDAHNDLDMYVTCLPAIEDVMEVWRHQASLGDPQVGMILHHDNTTEALAEYGPTLLAYGSDAAVYYGFVCDIVVQEIAT